MKRWYISVLRRYWDFDGRATRKEFWMFILYSALVQLTIAFVVGVITYDREITSLFTNLYVIAIFLPTLGLGMRRMHDIGRNGMWVFLPLVNLIFYCFDSQPHENEYGANPKLADHPA